MGATPTDHTPRYEDPMRNGAGGDPKSGSSGGGKVRSAVQGVIKNGATVGESTPQQEESRNTSDAQSQVPIAEGEAEKTHQTYFKDPKNPADGVYSGRTSGKGTPKENVAKRDQNHHMNKTHGPARLDKSSANSDAIRGREQQNIDKNGGAKSQGGTSGNAINSVSPKNKNAQRYEQAAKNEKWK